MKTSELTGPALDWAVAKSCGCAPRAFVEKDCGQGAIRPLSRWCGVDVTPCGHTVYSPSTNWSQGGPIIERDRIDSYYNGNWNACLQSDATGDPDYWTGPTPLIAAMRCFVASRLGDEVDVPAELED